MQIASRKVIAGLMVLALCITTLSSAGSDVEAKAKASLKTKKISVKVGKKKSILIKNKTKKYSYSFTSSNKQVAKVTSKGKVTGIKAGKATITVKEVLKKGKKKKGSSAAKENLNSAKNWGLVDMFGGGFFSTMLKHSKMDQAKQNMEQAKYDLRNFSRELNDVNMACNLHIDTGNFLSFADYFFDGFVVDWMVQDRINNAKRQVEEAIRRTESIVNQLQRM